MRLPRPSLSLVLPLALALPGAVACDGSRLDEPGGDAAQDRSGQGDGGDAAADRAGDAGSDRAGDASADRTGDRPWWDAAGEPAPDAPACSLAESWDYGYEGGFVAYTTRSHLDVPRTWRFVRTPAGGGGMPTSCVHDLPACGGGPTIDADDLDAALADPDVRAALAESPPLLFGFDSRPADGAIFTVNRAGGGAIQVGVPCAGRPTCRDIPDGITRLVTLLGQLDTQELMSPDCAGIGP